MTINSVYLIDNSIPGGVFSCRNIWKPLFTRNLSGSK